MTSWRNIPPLTALRAFAAFAEAGSVVRAGIAIGVSHAAVSQQIRALEAHLGVGLVHRGGRELVLTPEGEALAQVALQAFGSIAQVAGALSEAERSRPLMITTTPGLASGWLMPRLPDFRARHRGIDLALDPTDEMREIGPHGADVGLRYGDGIWPGLEAQLLLRSSVIVVAAPSLVAERAIERVSDLADLPWLQELGSSEATVFLEKHGVERGARYGLTSLPGNLVLEAVRNGQGVAALPRVFLEPDLAAGRLQLLFEDTEQEGYFIVTRPGPQRAPVQAFIRWALAQAHSSVEAPVSTR